MCVCVCVYINIYIYVYLYVYPSTRRRVRLAVGALRVNPEPGLNLSNLPMGCPRFGFVNPFRAGCFSDLGYGPGLLMVKSSPGVTPKSRFGPHLDSTDDWPSHEIATTNLVWCMAHTKRGGGRFLRNSRDTV